jgi:hypothetical protein
LAVLGVPREPLSAVNSRVQGIFQGISIEFDLELSRETLNFSMETGTFPPGDVPSAFSEQGTSGAI